uniref:TACO1/YebC-like second and third domain-containing protein n=1 Tax=Sinocyclocheilus grahami TaxID=75366 RepID=A0A672N462_SINGR
MTDISVFSTHTHSCHDFRRRLKTYDLYYSLNVFMSFLQLDRCSQYKPSLKKILENPPKSKPGVRYVYEATGPGGCTLLIEVLTDNNTRSHQEIKRILMKHGGALCEGSRWNFDRKGVVAASRDGISSERALELAIEAGAEDFICDIASMKAVRSALESLGVHMLSSGLEFVSHTPSLLTQTQLETVSSLLEALNDCPDVVRVWDNVHTQT